MNVFDNLRVAIGGISSNKLRSALTTLGVLIGVSAVIILVAVGTGILSGRREPDQPTRDEHPDGLQHGSLRKRGFGRRHPKPSGVVDDRGRQRAGER